MNIFLHHRDLRYQDNTTMIKQNKEEGSVTPIFIFDPIQIDPEKNKYFSNGFVQFMIESLDEYNKDQKIYFFYGETLDVLEAIHKKVKINSIGFNYEYSPFGKKRDNKIKEFAEKKEIKIYCEEDILLFNILDNQTLNPNNNRPFLVYTPYYNYLMTLTVREVDKYKNFKFEKEKKLEKIKYHFTDLHSLYTPNEHINVHGGRSLALKILKNIDKFKDYKAHRDTLTYRTTMLSAYINLNVVSIREVYYAIVNTFNKKHDLVRELIFREFYHTMFQYNPQLPKGNYYPKFDNYEWGNDTQLFNAWKNAKTGFPIVDAAMTQLITTNYMHNRMRMLTASFLIKNLNVDWRKGEQFFAQQLEDYSIYSNWGGWTNIADAAPSAQSYFRVFSPEAHSKKYDKDCEYIKFWLPQLKDVPNKDIHTWEKSHQKYLDMDIKYYAPIINFSESRKEYLKIYSKM